MQKKYLEVLRKIFQKINTVLTSTRSRNMLLDISCQKISFCQLMTFDLDECKNLKGFYRMKVESYMPNELFLFYSEGFNTILRNLLSNSIYSQNYRLNDPTINIWLDYATDNSIPIVRVNGVGIPVEKQSHLFTTFYLSSEQSNGSGFWLYLCNETIKRLHGTIKIIYKVGKETTEVVQIPILFPV